VFACDRRWGGRHLGQGRSKKPRRGGHRAHGAMAKGTGEVPTTAPHGKRPPGAESCPAFSRGGTDQRADLLRAGRHLRPRRCGTQSCGNGAGVPSPSEPDGSKWTGAGRGIGGGAINPMWGVSAGTRTTGRGLRGSGFSGTRWQYPQKKWRHPTGGSWEPGDRGAVRGVPHGRVGAKGRFLGRGGSAENWPAGRGGMRIMPE